VAVAGVADTVCPAHAKLHKAFIAGHAWQLIAHAPTAYQVWSESKSDTFSVSALIGLVTLTPLTSNLVRVIARGVGNLLNNFDVLDTFGDFSFSTYGKMRKWPLTLELMALVGYMGHRVSSVYQIWSS